MSDRFLASFGDLDGLRASRVWSSLSIEERADAARALYAPDRNDPETRRHADAAIAEALRFREAAVRQWPIERRVARVSRLSVLEERLAATLLLALHLGYRRPMLAAFLDALGISHENGAILDAARLAPPPTDALAAACDRLFGAFAPDEVEIYLASLLALDPDTWGGLAAILGRRRSPGPEPSRGGLSRP